MDANCTPAVYACQAILSKYSLTDASNWFYTPQPMQPLSISEVARKAKVTRQAVSIALDEGRLTVVKVIGRRAVSADAKFRRFLKGTRNRPNGKGKSK